jgi:hypothetical protein
VSDFLSHRKLGKLQPIDIDTCRWASCSFYLSETSVRRIKKFKDSRVAKLDIPAQNGMMIERNGHVDFWAFEGVDLSKFVVEVL